MSLNFSKSSKTTTISSRCFFDVLAFTYFFNSQISLAYSVIVSSEVNL